MTIALRVTEGPTVDTATTTYEISNVAPVATVQLPASVVAGVPTTVKVGAEDPSPTDAAAQFEYRIDWDGDGLAEDVVAGPADPPVTHTYPSAGDRRPLGRRSRQGRRRQHSNGRFRHGQPRRVDLRAAREPPQRKAQPRRVPAAWQPPAPTSPWLP